MGYPKMKNKIIANMLSSIVVCFALGMFPQQLTAQQQDSTKSPIILLSSKILKDASLNIKLTKSFDITPRGEILLSTADQLYLLKWEEIIPLEPKMEKPINSFTYTSDNLLVVVSDSSLCYMDEFSQLVELYKLPKKNMGVSAGDSALYIYDETIILPKTKQKLPKTKQKYAIYLLPKNGKHFKLAELNTPITSVIEANKDILISTENKILSVNVETKQVKALINLHKTVGNIVSMARDFDHDIIYFTTKKGLYFYKEGKAYPVIDELTGIVRYYHNQLFLFNAEKQFLILFEIEAPQ
jgi:hypothetical protein